MAYTAHAQSLNIVQRSRVPYPGTSNIWGYVDTTGKEYALVGANDRTSIVDVSDPDNPIKRFSVPDSASQWREIRTWGKYAYVTTEGGGGVHIIDLSKLPDTVTYKKYKGDGAIANQIFDVHALHIDNGKLYLYGGQLQQGRAKVFSLNDPWNPHYLGTVSQRYVHDGFVKNDTLYSCQIYAGLLEIIDAKNPQAPVVISSQVTPKAFTHNSWLSTDGKVVYTTDEKSGSWVTAYDITDFQNIKELDRYRHNNSGSIGHNTYVLNNANITGHNTDFLWTSYYTDGITLVDASRPNNLVEVAYFDSSPQFSGDGFNGAWGVYPYLPSGNILISDIERGMHVVTPTYKRASYLEGVIRDINTNLPIAGANVVVVGKANMNEATNASGEYRSGTVDTGFFAIKVSSPGYITYEDTVHLMNGQVTPLNITLSKRVNFNFSTTVKDSNNQALANVNVLIENAEFKHELVTDGSGNINIPTFFAGKYALYAGKFGYKTLFIDSTDYQNVNDVPSIVLAKGYYDDFIFNFGWTTNSTASTGDWVRAKPIRTALNGVVANPDFDLSNDYGNMCYVTGNASGNVTTADVDNGTVVLTSPTFDIANYTNPHVNYNRWFTNIATNGSPNDTLTISLSNGTQTAIVEQVIGNTPDKGQWVAKAIRVKDFLTPSANMKLIVKTADLATSDHIVEAGLDMFLVSDSAAVIQGLSKQKNNIYAKVYPNPSLGSAQLSYNLVKAENAKLSIYDILGNKVLETTLRDTYGIVNINIENKGMYFIRIQTDTEQKVIKFTKQ